MKTLLSLFDFTGAWSQPFREAGWNVIQLDLKHGHDISLISPDWLEENISREHPIVHGVLAAPPCTDFTVSGARWWPEKDADGRTAASIHLVEQTMMVIDYFRPDWWALENPVGRISDLVPRIGRAKLLFDPCDFAGFLPWSEEEQRQTVALRLKWALGQPFTADEMDFTRDKNLYTKRTVLYGTFAPLETRRIEPIRTTEQGSWLMALGGKSEATKAARSVTPEGFSRAFYLANRDHRDLFSPRRTEKRPARVA